MTTPKTPAELLRNFPFFAGLDEQTYAELLAGARTRRYAKGETIFLDGEPCKGLFFVQSGTVKIYKISEAGREQIIHIQRAGDALAELPLFDNGPYPAAAAAMEDSSVLFIPKAAFDDLLARRPQLCRAVIAALAKRLRNMVELVENLSCAACASDWLDYCWKRRKAAGHFTCLSPMKNWPPGWAPYATSSPAPERPASRRPHPPGRPAGGNPRP